MKHLMTEATLKIGESHPMAHSAFSYVKLHANDPILLESIASTALSGSRCAEICHSTLERIRKGEPVSDRYVFGLAWMIKDIKDNT